MTNAPSARVLYGAAALVLVLAAVLGYALWRDSQTRTIEFSIGEDGVAITES